MSFYDGYFKNSKVCYTGSFTNLRDQYTNDEYAQALYQQEQDYYEQFDLQDLTGIVKGVAKGDVFSLLFEGESGTGKSTAARVIASRCGLPFVAINCSTNIEESDIFGTMIPNPEKHSVDDPEFIWQDGPLTKAIRYGYVGIIEELGFARPGVLGKINSLLDESRQIDLTNGEVLKAHPNFRIIATTNIGYEGTNRLNKALVNRFEICKKFIDLDVHSIKEVIKSRTGYSDMSKMDKILEVYRAIQKYSKEQNLNLVISIRQLLNIFRQGKYYKSAREAVDSLLLNQAFLEEPDHLEYFSATILNVFNLSFKL
jgi:MoxR-like ATPase